MGFRDEFVHISFRKEDFRVTFLHPFLVVFLAALAVSEFFFWYTGNFGVHLALGVIPAVVLLLCVLAVSILRVRYRFVLGPDGIQCFDFWCRPHETAWDNVSDVRHVNTAGLEYLQVYLCNSSKTIWIPLFVGREKSLRQLLLTYTHNSMGLYNKIDSILQ